MVAVSVRSFVPLSDRTAGLPRNHIPSQVARSAASVSSATTSAIPTVAHPFPALAVSLVIVPFAFACLTAMGYRRWRMQRPESIPAPTVNPEDLRAPSPYILPGMESFHKHPLAPGSQPMTSDISRPASVIPAPSPYLILDMEFMRLQQATAHYHSASPEQLSPVPSQSKMAPTLPHHNKQAMYGKTRNTKTLYDRYLELRPLSYSTGATPPPLYASTTATSVTHMDIPVGLPSNPRPIYRATLEPPPPSFQHRPSASLNALPSYSAIPGTLVHKKSQSVGDPTSERRPISPFERTSLKPPRIPSSVFSSFQSSSRRSRPQGSLSIQGMQWNRTHAITSETPPPLPSHPGPQSRTYRYLKERTLF